MRWKLSKLLKFTIKFLHFHLIELNKEFYTLDKLNGKEHRHQRRIYIEISTTTKKENANVAKMCAHFQSSPWNEETKNTDRTRKRVKKAFCSKVTAFKELINFQPYYISVDCNHCLYRISVCTFRRDTFSAYSDMVFSLVLSFDGNFYICVTCGKKLKKNCILCDLAKEFRDIQRLEKVLVAKRSVSKT